MSQRELSGTIEDNRSTISFYQHSVVLPFLPVNQGGLQSQNRAANACTPTEPDGLAQSLRAGKFAAGTQKLRSAPIHSR